MSQPEKIEFQTEIRQILDLVIHSLYTHKEIFLRELISNASDAIDKLRFEALTHHDWAPKGGGKIRIETDAAANTLSVVDNGIGMNREELISNIGTIARSGSKEFLKAIADRQNAPPELIGQFGVGFYSAFMVADRVTILTRRAGEEKACKWESAGDGTFTIEEGEKPETGTTITLHLKRSKIDDIVDSGEAESDREPDFTEEWKIREIVRKYSDFIQYPVTMMVQRDEPAMDAEGKPVPGAAMVKVVKEETLNSMKALWARPAKEITKEEYQEFFKHLAHDWQEPLSTIHFSAEGLLEYQALLFIPGHAPFDIFTPERHHGIKLYAKRVFIMDDCKELIPEYLRCVKGLVDSADISLNVSRETIQQNRQIVQIRKRLVRKVLDTLSEMKEKNREEYIKFWDEFARVLKEGFFTEDEHLETLKSLLLFETSADPEKYSSLSEYVSRMPAEQKEIYYLTGESRAALENSPHLEALKAKNYEVIFFTDPVDEFAVRSIGKFDEKPLKSAAKGDLDLGATEEKKPEESAKYSSLIEFLTGRLKEQVREVRLSKRLKSSAVCLVMDESGMAAHVEKLMRQNNQAIPAQKRILELNPEHPLTEKLQKMFDENRGDPRLSDYADLLYGQAALTEGVPLPDPVKFANLVARIM